MKNIARFIILIIFSSACLTAQVVRQNVTISDCYDKIDVPLPSGARIFYVNLIDSANNIVSTNFVTLGDTSTKKSSISKRIQFDPTVWTVPKIYNDVPDSLNYPYEKAFYYAGLNYQGNKTKVFAYIGFPPNASSNNKVPAVVLVHGGAGTAFPQWVKLWNDKGYAAIAMDLDGCQPLVPEGYKAIRIADSVTGISGGPDNSSFADINRPVEEQWMYHAVADVYLAYTILASDDRVDKNQIGITGISCGGIITSIAVSNADCFAFAVPVYGCGFLNTSKGFHKKIYNEAVTKQWESSNWLGTVKKQTLWINGDSDKFFSIDATSRSAQSTDNSSVTIIPGFLHSHVDGWSPQEIYTFANSVTKGSKGLIKILKQPAENDLTICFDAANSCGAKSAVLVYSQDPLTYDDNNKLTNVWLKMPLKIPDWYKFKVS